MKKTIIAAVLGAAAVCAWTPAHATRIDLDYLCEPLPKVCEGGDIFWDIDYHGVHVSEYGSPVYGSLNIAQDDGDGLNKADYNKALMELKAAFLGFLFTEDEFLDSKEVASIYLDCAEDPINNGFFLGFSLFGDLVSGDLFATLSETGEILYKITAKKGDFVFWGAGLAAAACPKPQVPDGGATVFLLGLGLAGLAMWGRRAKS